MDERTLARFRARIKVLDNGCWHWTGGTNKQGYGRFYVGRRNGRNVYVQPHRESYKHFVKAIPPGMDVDHQCHNADLSCKGGRACLHRRCCNPEHLAPCEHGQNAKRSRNTIASINAAKETCDDGHEFTVVRDSRGRTRRKCMTCKNAKDMRRWKERFDTDPEFRERKRRQSREGAARRRAREKATHGEEAHG